MNISRRGFLKLLGTSVAVVTAEAAVPGITKTAEPQTAKFTHVIPGLQSGTYTFSYFFKPGNPNMFELPIPCKPGATVQLYGSDWYRVSRQLTVEDDMDLRCEVEVQDGDCVCSVQLEREPSTPYYVETQNTNHISGVRYNGFGRRVENLIREPYIELNPGPATFVERDGGPHGGKEWMFVHLGDKK